MNSTEFINTAYPAAVATQNKYGLPALAIIAQSALETGFGKSIVGNMYLGIKAGTSWNGKRQLLWTHEEVNGVSTRVQAWFRAYNSAYESFMDYGNFITSNPRYADALNFPDDPENYIKAVAHAGYATDSNYANKIISIISDLKNLIVETGISPNLIVPTMVGIGTGTLLIIGAIGYLIYKGFKT